MNKKWSAFIHGSGTGGTIEGISRYIQTQNGFIKNHDVPTKVYMAIPEESPHGI